MSDYQTNNPVPSTDPRDLDDNATIYDRLLNTAVASVPDRTGVSRKTWWQLEQDAAALMSPNVSALAALTGANNTGFYFTGSGAMSTYALTAFGRSFLGAADAAAQQTALNWAAPLASPTFTGVPKAPTAAVGTNTTQLATMAAIQAEIANKRAWTSYTPTVAANTGTYTAASATGSFMVAFGICHVRIRVTITTKGTGSLCTVTLPQTALLGAENTPLFAKGAAVNFVTGSGVISVARNTILLTDYLGADIISGNGVVVDIAGSYPIA